MAGDSITPDPIRLKAIAHPLRHRILLLVGEQVSSPKEIAAELGEPLGRVSHHVRVLARLGAIELVETAQRRGAVEHFYRAVVRSMFDDEDWARLPVGVRRAIFAEYLGRIVAAVAEAAAGSGFEHPRSRVVLTPLDLDEEGFDAVADVLGDAVMRVLAVCAAAAGRIAQADGERTPMQLALLHFEHV